MAGGTGGPVDFNDPQQWFHPGLNPTAGFEQLHHYVKSGNLQQVIAAIDPGGGNLLVQNTHEERTALHHAVFRMHENMVRAPYFRAF